MKKPTLKQLQEKYIPMYVKQQKPVQSNPRVPIALSLLIETVLHPMLKLY